jgi:hypothetical protein
VLTTAVEHREVEGPPRAEAMVVGDVPCLAVRRVQIADDMRHERRDANRRGAVGRKMRIDRGFELSEGAGQRRRSLIEQTISAAHYRRRRRIEEHGRADPRRCAHAVDDAVAIEAGAVLEVPARRRLQTILCEHRDVDPVSMLRRWTGPVEAPGERPVGALDENRSAHARAVVVARHHVGPDFDEVLAAEPFV